MDYSKEIAEAITFLEFSYVEVHKSTSNPGRYRLYTFDVNDNLLETMLVSVDINRKNELVVKAAYGRILGTKQL